MIVPAILSIAVFAVASVPVGYLMILSRRMNAAVAGDEAAARQVPGATNPSSS